MMRRISWHLPALTFFLALALTPGCTRDEVKKQTDSAFDRISDAKRLRVGYIVFPPAITKDANTQALGGHFVETIKEIAKQAEWQIEFVETDWSGFSAGLDSKRFDLSIAPTFVTIPRAKAVSFTRPLFYAGNSAILRKGDQRFSDILSLDRSDVTISVTQGEAGHEYAKANFKNAKIRVLPGPDQSLTFQDVVAGRSDAALGDAYVTAKFAHAHQDSVVDHFSGNPYNLTPVSWSVPLREPELLSFFNAAIEVLDTQGKLLELERKSGATWLHSTRNYTLDDARKP